MDFSTFAASSLYRTTRKKRPNRKQANIMTHKMRNVVKSYLVRYNPDGYYTVTNENIMKNISMIVIPFMTTILNKYNEEDFHNAMKRRYYDEDGNLCWGWDYIADIKRNHPLAFRIARSYARMYKSKLNFNVNVAAELMIDIMLNWSWKVWPHEKQAIHHILYRIHRLIQES